MPDLLKSGILEKIMPLNREGSSEEQKSEDTEIQNDPEQTSEGDSVGETPNEAETQNDPEQTNELPSKERSKPGPKAKPKVRKYMATKAMLRDPITQIAYYPNRITEGTKPAKHSWLESQIKAGLITEI